MRRLILIGLAAGALGACALPTDRPGPQALWSVTADAGEARLALGVPETDELALRMTCRPHSGEVDLTIVGRHGDPAVLELHSGEVWGRYSGAGHEDEAGLGGFDIDLKLPTSDPVLTHLGDKGELSIVFPTRRIALPNAFSQAHDFLAVCRPL
jgi:hypothetical protein